MQFKYIRYEVKNRVGVVTLNRPERLNAYHADMHAEMKDVLRHVTLDTEVRTLVFTGAGEGFCSGADLKVMAQRGPRSPVSRATSFREGPASLAVLVYGLEKPTIAAVNGVAVGLGFSLTLACDIRIASEKARFGQIFVKRGLIPDTGSTYLLPRAVGMANACELVFTGKVINSAEAQRIGLVSRVVPHEELMAESLRLAREVGKGSPLALALAKRALQRGTPAELAEAIEYESYVQSICLETEDHREGLKAFLEKREPSFTGA